MEEKVNQARKRTPAQLNQELACRWCGSRHLEEAGEVKGYHFVECLNCCFTFCPSLTQEAMERRYAQGYHASEEGVPKKGWSKTNFLAPVLEFYPSDTKLRILDFGSGQSVVPDELRKQGHKVIAVDVTEPLHPHPDRLTGKITDLKLEPDQFDLVYSFQVFEHLPEPRPVFEELLRLTKPGGYLLIHTDMEPPERQEGFEQWWYVLPPDHCSFYKKETFEWLLEESPHELVEAEAKHVIIQKNGRTFLGNKEDFQ